MVSVDLSWNHDDSSVTEDAFVIYRTTTSSPTFPNDYSEIAQNGADNTTYTDSDAPSGTVYYAVTASNSGIESDPDTTSIQTTTAPTITGTLSSSVSADDITLSLPSVDWGGEQDHYNILRAQSTGGAYTEIGTALASDSTYTDSGLQGGEQYYYVVTAENSVGTSGQSNEVSETTSLPQPTNVQITDDQTEDELTVDWGEVSGAAGYYVYRAQASGTTKSDYTQIADVTSPPYTDTNLEDGEQYFYRVSSHD